MKEESFCRSILIACVGGRTEVPENEDVDFLKALRLFLVFFLSTFISDILNITLEVKDKSSSADPFIFLPSFLMTNHILPPHWHAKYRFWLVG